MTITRFDHAYLDTLCTQARASPRLRQHRNVHTDYADPCQRVFNAITTRSYLVPHRHALSPRDETMLAVRGRLALVRHQGSFMTIREDELAEQNNLLQDVFLNGELLVDDNFNTIRERSSTK